MTSTTLEQSAPSSASHRTSFITDFSANEINQQRQQLDLFVAEHLSHHRPIALVSSGGTKAHFEQHSVRCLDNFSTGLRGAVAVEEFLRRGYAVIHLWRQGSASPFARVVSHVLGVQPGQHGLTVDSLAKLFALHAEEEDKYVQTVLEEERDAFLSDATALLPQQLTDSNGFAFEQQETVALNRAIIHSSRVQKALREQTIAVDENRLLTVSFETVEEYLARLELACCAVQPCSSLAVLYLAAAVSDFYIPPEERVEHKIQSHDSSELILRLYPVPKLLKPLRLSWSPDAFVVSFKLETDQDILRQKAESAVAKYGVHMVIGNLLHTRHERVSVLSPVNQREKHPSTAERWNTEDIVKPRSGKDQDALESSIIDFVVQSHFEYISWHFGRDGAGLEAARRANELFTKQKRAEQLEGIFRQVRAVALEWTGVLVSVVLTYYINVAIQRRLQLG